MLYDIIITRQSVPELMIPLIICSTIAVAEILYVLFLGLSTGDKQERLELVRTPIEDLSFLAELGTLLGLFGTVVGIILSFADIMGGGSESLGSNLSTALYTTAYGMAIAIMSLSFHHVYRRMFLEQAENNE